MTPVKGWIGVDLDGTLAEYHGWVSEEHIGEPIAPMLARVKAWLADGVDVRIFTARVDGGEVALSMGDAAGERFRDVERIRGFIDRWCQKHIGRTLPVTNRKDYGMVELWDDRAVQVRPNTGIPVDPERRDSSIDGTEKQKDDKPLPPGTVRDGDGNLHTGRYA